MLSKYSAVLLAVVVLAGCDQSATSPSATSTVTIGQPTPLAGSRIRATGNFIIRGSGDISIPITIQSGRDVTWAQLYVYLLTANGYCGQNLPDAPTWGGLERGQRASVTISGFQVYRLPCQVTGFRAILHTRNNGLLLPPTTSETIAEATLTAAYTIE